MVTGVVIVKPNRMVEAVSRGRCGGTSLAELPRTFHDRPLFLLPDHYGGNDDVETIEYSVGCLRVRAGRELLGR